MLHAAALALVLAAGDGGIDVFPLSDSEWTNADTALEATGLALQVADWSTTLGLPRGSVESNPLLGPHPTRAQVTGYMAATAAIHVTVAYLLPRPYRTWWQAIWIAGEAACVGGNVTLGARFALP